MNRYSPTLNRYSPPSFSIMNEYSPHLRYIKKVIVDQVLSPVVSHHEQVLPYPEQILSPVMNAYYPPSFTTMNEYSPTMNRYSPP